MKKIKLISNSNWLLAIYSVAMLNICMPARAENPLFTNIYTADPAPHGNFGDGKLYVYTTHDTDHGGYGDMYDYHAYSTTNLIDWIDHGSVLNVTDFKWTRGSRGAAWDGDCQKGPDGKYYYYAPIQGQNKIGVAVSDSPTGPFVDALGYPLITKKTPGVKRAGLLVTANVFFYKDDPYMLFGQDIFYVVKLKRNMIELADDAVTQIVKPEKPYFWEGPWIDYHNGVFTMTCVVKNQETGRPEAGTIDYATSTNPYGPYVYKGVVMQRTGLNEQMGIAHFNDKHYFFYHIDGPRGGKRRYTCVEEFKYLPNGDMPKIEQTKNGVGGVCTIKHDAFGRFKGDDYTGSSPGIKQNSSKEDGPNIMYVESMKNKSWISFKNFDFGAGAASFEIEVDSAGKGGLIELRIDSPDGQIIGSTTVGSTDGETRWKNQTGPIKNARGVHDLYMVFNGDEELNLKVRHFRFKRNGAK
ncbi:MAG: carbohydrate-binding protein [Verrucomicrobia bacterium]|nr:carbohydrate-binding protein [Verrucomicrobiota bacterium]